MNKEMIPALIAFIGVIVSSLIAFFTSLRVARNESAKLSVEAKKLYDSKALDMRYNTYPALYALCSDLVKSLRKFPGYAAIDPDLINRALLEINQWDSKNSIYFGPFTGIPCSNLRKLLKSLVGMKQEELEEWLTVQSNISTLTEAIRGLELALRSDLGAYGLDTSKTGLINFVSTKSKAQKMFPPQKG